MSLYFFFIFFSTRFLLCWPRFPMWPMRVSAVRGRSEEGSFISGRRIEQHRACSMLVHSEGGSGLVACSSSKAEMGKLSESPRPVLKVILSDEGSSM